jgi:hypothetical protein
MAAAEATAVVPCRGWMIGGRKGSGGFEGAEGKTGSGQDVALSR